MWDPVAGTVIRRIRASATERDIPLSGLSTIAAAFDAPAVEAFADRLLITRPDDVSTAALTAEFLSLIRESGAHPTLLLIDDADRLDELSRSVLAMMAHRLGGTGLRLVATATGPLGPALASMPRTHCARSITTKRRTSSGRSPDAWPTRPRTASSRLRRRGMCGRSPT